MSESLGQNPDPKEAAEWPLVDKFEDDKVLTEFLSLDMTPDDYQQHIQQPMGYSEYNPTDLTDKTSIELRQFTDGQWLAVKRTSK